VRPGPLISALPFLFLAPVALAQGNCNGTTITVTPAGRTYVGYGARSTRTSLSPTRGRSWRTVTRPAPFTTQRSLLAPKRVTQRVGVRPWSHVTRTRTCETRPTGRTPWPRRTTATVFRTSVAPARCTGRSITAYYPSTRVSVTRCSTCRGDRCGLVKVVKAPPARTVYYPVQEIPEAPAIPLAPATELRQKPSLAVRLLEALEADDLQEACRLAAWTKSSPRREQVLRRALFNQFPSPSLLQRVMHALRTGSGCEGSPGRDTLLRVLEGDRT